MASAEQLLNEAHYAFHSISYSEARENRRSASRARSLCKKIIRRFPTSTEAAEAHAILRRLGEEAYSSKIEARHRHTTQAEHHQAPSPEAQRTFIVAGDAESLDWGGLLAWLFMLPKAVLVMIALAGLLLFGIVGPLLFSPLLVFVLLSGPFRKTLKPEQRAQIDEFVTRINSFVAERRKA